MKKLKKAKSRATKIIDEAEKLADLHIRLCPAAQVKHRKGLITKCRKLLERYTPEQIRAVVENCSHRARRGDGWGVILACMPFAETKLRERALIANVERDRREHPKQPARGKSQPVILHGEEWTQREQNRQVRAILAEKNKMYLISKKA